MWNNQRVDLTKKTQSALKINVSIAKKTTKTMGATKCSDGFSLGTLREVPIFLRRQRLFLKIQRQNPPFWGAADRQNPTPHSEVGQIWGIWRMIPGKKHRFLHELPDVEMPRKLQKDSCYIRNCPPTCDGLLVQTSFPKIVKVWLWLVVCRCSKLSDIFCSWDYHPLQKSANQIITHPLLYPDYITMLLDAK